MLKNKNKHLGALSELRATIWLLEQGYEVFENVSSHGKYDLIVRDQFTGELFPVDVTSGQYYIKKNGDVSLLHARKKPDILTLVVMPDGKMYWYNIDEQKPPRTS